MCSGDSGRRSAERSLGREETARQRHEFAVDELANGRPAAAVTALKQALALDPMRASAYNDLGLALTDLGRLDEAEAAYREAVRLDATYVVAYQNLGDLLQARGRLKEACGCFESALRIDPELRRSRMSLGDALADQGELAPAAGCFREVIARNPTYAGAYSRLGSVLWKMGDAHGALDAFERSAAVGPASAQAHYNIGSALLELHRFDEAIRSAAEALRLRPAFPEALTLYSAAMAATGAVDAGVESLRRSHDPDLPAQQLYLALAGRLMSSRLFEPARSCLERALRQAPDDVMAHHLLAALSGENPDRPRNGYIRQLFDASAATFDLEVGSKLRYAIPREMVEALLADAGAPPRPWSVIDLGCGTGLVGVEIAPHSRRLVGIDLAPNMIEHARGRGIYSELCCTDILTALRQEEESRARYDVVTAADVFIYVGKLDEVIPAIRRVLNSGGLFAFSAEAAEAVGRSAPEGYRLGLMGRYAHREDYLRGLAEQNGFHVELLRKTRIRFEHRQPVEGWLTVWRAGDPARR